MNCIQLKFYGKVCLHLKEKQVDLLFEDTCALYPDNTNMLDASEHSFPFQFTVPNHLKLPSSMQFGKKCYIRYTISALLDRPMIPESLCPKTEYDVSILEFIDIQTSQFNVPQEKVQPIFISNQKCIVKASISRLGFTRGDIIPLQVTIHHFTSCSRKKCIKVELLRNIEIRTIRHTVTKETILKSTEYDINVDYTHQQSLTCQLLVPTSTPPSIRYKDKLLRFHYKVRLSVSFTDKATCLLDLPIVIGTWPRASIPIDDEFEEDLESLGTVESIRNSVISSDDIMGRSNSVKSYNSISSWNSWENRTAITSLSSPASFSQPRYSTIPRCIEEVTVPTHVLQPVNTINQQQEQINSHYDSSSTTDDDSDEEDDLLAIIKKKKKKEQKELRKKMNQLQVS
ncbi:hypothetical protein G6F37_003006 [Rhizopus arrhizus]|nr:hypothetical protein G6F38_001845 [Rhizopus arrhizus]KAG1161514.1 hypothetical protein G6F37_003006 [Rhizopus arrhizus]